MGLSAQLCVGCYCILDSSHTDKIIEFLKIYFSITSSIKMLLFQPTVELRELESVLCGDLNGKEIQQRGDVCICTADSLCSTVETNTAL